MIDRLASLALLAMLALAPVNARAQSSPLTPEVLKKILQLMVSVGKDFESPAILATALGFTVAGQPWPNREIEAKESRPNFLHGFSETRGDEPDILITLRGLDSIRAFRAHRDGKIVRAAVYDFNTRQIATIDPIQAQKELDTELQFWANGVNALPGDSK
jgi:hypothetical protein